ncbi:MAG: 30S ribosomal protein S4 [Eubacteriaceae bacterium]|nr:30S ribosomal protein S4 [Eubacteriaceae bacterium]
MARYTDASCRLCRREKEKLYLKGDRCYSAKCALSRRSYAPGQHGKKNAKLSEYGTQLREKQKVKRIYGVLEKQFKEYYEIALKKGGVTGEHLLMLLESRLDNVVYRLGFAKSRKEARQLVLHNHFTVDGHKTNIPSYIVKPGQTIQLKEKSKKSPKFIEIIEDNQSRPVPNFLTVDFEAMKGSMLSQPTKEHIEIPIQEQLIVELYSK